MPRKYKFLSPFASESIVTYFYLYVNCFFAMTLASEDKLTKKGGKAVLSNGIERC
jgi:hypothetical protein